jgi:decaprenylphospho-beta-D-ribofuranose 2-oxidase
MQFSILQPTLVSKDTKLEIVVRAGIWRCEHKMMLFHNRFEPIFFKKSITGYTRLLPKNQQLISGWGHFPRMLCTLYRPEKISDLADAMRSCHAGMVARGMGKSYGDAALNMSGTIVTERLSRFLKFDAKTGVIRVEAGVTLADLMKVIIPKGWFLPVIPGTKYATVGGCFASNVHGKNAYKVGEFAAHVQAVLIRLVNGKSVECTPKEHADIFWATAGGMGMTGVIEEVQLQLMPISSAQIEVQSIRVQNIEEMLAQFRHHRKEGADYMVGWIDHFGKGSALGRGVFEAASHLKESKPETLRNFELRQPEFDMPFYLPAFVMNKYLMAYYNRSRFSSVSKEPKKSVVAFDSFFHPLDAIGKWNKLYGRRGFLQYQCLIPESKHVLQHARKVLSLIQESDLFSCLAVIKYHGKKEGMLSFSDEGFSLALDFLNTAEVHKLLDALDAYVCQIGGRVYLAKDARLKPQYFEKMYQHALPRWRRVLKEIDPKRKINSAMSERLGFRKEL